MTVWSHLPTIFSQRFALRLAGLLALSIAFITTLIFADVSQAAPGINQSLGFQGRLLRSNGGVVPDGHYNIQFKIYQDGAGAAVNNPGGSLEWTESHVNNGSTGGVRVKNGYFSVDLGAKTAFGDSVDWNQDTLWLSMNVAGTASDCTTFGSGSCTADGEMLPMKRMTAVPYAMNSGTVGGKSASDLVQLGQGVQTDASSNTSSIFINKTGTGNLVQLQGAGVDLFTVDNGGNVTLGNASDRTLSIGTAAANTEGGSLTVNGGNGGSGTGAAGGDLTLQGGSAGGTDGAGGNISIDAGAATGTGQAGSISIGSTNAGSISIGSTGASDQTITIGANDTTGSSTDVTVGAGGNASGGSTTIRGKDDVSIETDGTTQVTFDGTDTAYFGNGKSSNTPNDYTIQGTNSTATGVSGGSITLQGGNATTGNADGGSLNLDAGVKSGSGNDGAITIGAANASNVTIGRTNSNTTTNVLGAAVFKPTVGNDSTTAFQLQRANGTAMFVSDSVNQTITIGNPASSNKIVISTATGQMVKYGTARNSKKIMLNAEYTGAVLDAGSMSNNSGTMTSSYDMTNRMNYYKWTTSQSTNQNYDVVVQVPLPSDFDGWDTDTPIAISTYTSSTIDGTISLTLLDSANDTQCDDVDVTPGSNTTWAQAGAGCNLSIGTYSAGDYITLRIRMQSPNGGDVRIGKIDLNYLSKF